MSDESDVRESPMRERCVLFPGTLLTTLQIRILQMAVEHFELNEHPFLLTPAVNEYFETDAMRASRERLEICLQNGGGISVVTAEAGLGKTSLLYQLGGNLAPEFRVVLLKSLAFTTAEDLLKAILFELDIPYRKLREQDLRLRLVQSARKLKSLHEGIVILADEAHLANPTVLNELRSLTNFVDSTPLFRVLVAGQLELEEQFADRELAAFVQRISCQESLAKLTRQESMDYIDARISAAGGDLEIVCDEEALQLISYAADGSPRNINQLCECAMRMAAANNEKPISRSSAKAALDELQKLPIRWNIPAEVESETAMSEVTSSTEAIDVAIDDDGAIELGYSDSDQFLDSEMEVKKPVEPQQESSVVETLDDDENGFAIEFGAGLEISETETEESEVVSAVEDDESPAIAVEVECAEEATVIEIVVEETSVELDTSPVLEERELDIEDRYAELDYRRQQLRPGAQVTQPDLDLQSAIEEPEESETGESEEAEITSESPAEELMIEVDIQHTIAELTEAASHLLSASGNADDESSEIANGEKPFDIVLPEA